MYILAYYFQKKSGGNSSRGNGFFVSVSLSIDKILSNFWELSNDVVHLASCSRDHVFFVGPVCSRDIVRTSI